jgi:hypothetical protein
MITERWIKHLIKIFDLIVSASNEVSFQFYFNNFKSNQIKSKKNLLRNVKINNRISHTLNYKFNKNIFPQIKS